MSSPETTAAGDVRRRGWSVFDHVKPFPPTPSPDALIADIDAAIAASELSHSSSLLSNLQLNHHQHQQDQEDDDDDDDDESSNDSRKNQNRVIAAVSAYDARLADESYKAACAALASGRHEAAVRSLRIAIASCPPDKASAIAKLRSLMVIAESQLKQQQQQ